MKRSELRTPLDAHRRTFLKGSLLAAGAGALGTGWLADPLAALGEGERTMKARGPM